MGKKSVTFNIKKVNVHVCGSALEEIDESREYNALNSMVKKLDDVNKSIKSRLAASLAFIEEGSARVKNDQDFRVITHAILKKHEDVVLETPEATAFLKELIEKGWFKDKMHKEEKKEPAPAQANGL